MEQLNKFYCAQSHLRERLSELLDHADFLDIHAAMLKTIEETDDQILNTEKIYNSLGRKHSFEKCANLLAVLEDDFNQVQINSQDTRLRDISLLSYLQNVQHIASSAIERISLGQSKITALIMHLKANIAPGESLLPGESLKRKLLERLHQASE